MTSRFVTLSDYCILEFMMTPPGDPAPQIINSDYYFVKNAHVDLFQIYNNDAYSAITKNTRGQSVVPIGSSRLVRVDLTDIPIYTQYDPNITETAISNSLSSMLIMDTMRFHFASGFNFTEVENIVLGARQKLNDLRQLQLASILIDSQTATDLLTFNPRPLFLSNTVYDKYVDIKIPTLSYLDEDFNQFGSASFEYAITDGVGFIKGSPITVSLSEATYEDLYADNGEKYEMYKVVNYYEGSVPQVNEFDSFGAIVQEATDGDYIEFFATWNNAFPEDLISTLNANGPDNDWIFVHQLQVYEQVGSITVPSGNLTIYQEDNFDVPLSYRPILKEAGFAISMSIDYTVRLLNKKNGDQVIRTGSMTLFNPNKYGKNLVKLELADKPQSMKVYNKIVQKNLEISNLFNGQKAPTPVTAQSQIVYVPTEVKVSVPTFFKQAYIRVSQKSALLKASDGTADLIFGQGELVLPIDPTDNFVKFTVYEANPVKPGEQTTANLNINSTFSLNFGKDAKYSYASVKDPAIENPSIGQIAFRVPKDQAKKILESTDQLMFISVTADDGTETMLYTGKWMSSDDYASILKANEASKNALLNDPQETIAKLKKSVEQLEADNQSLRNKLVSQSAISVAVKPENIKTINAISGLVKETNLKEPVEPLIRKKVTKKTTKPTKINKFIKPDDNII